MSEEITNAPVAVPRSIMLSVLINGPLGFSMLIAMLFCLGDIEAALVSPTGYPFMAIFLQATHSVAGTATMGAIITTMGICTSVGMLASTSRQFWSFARDRGIPGWRLWSRVCIPCIFLPPSSPPPTQKSITDIHLGDPRIRHPNLLRRPHHNRRLPTSPNQHRLLSRL